ncbi:MAG TPA: hypothetical protein VFR97_01300 [Capillimicrobium sp.]|nr:hypothetical protein [Capillimicrobium sp.]
MLPADPVPDLHRPRGPRLAGLSVVLVRRDRCRIGGAVRRAHLAAAAVAQEHEVIVLDRVGDVDDRRDARVMPLTAGEELPGAAAVARLEWLVVADARRAPALAGITRCLTAAPDHAIVLGRRIDALPPQPVPPRRIAHSFTLLARHTRRRAPARSEEFPFVLLRRDLARRLGVVAGSHLPAADLAVLAVLLDARAAIVRVHDRPACRPAAASGAPRHGVGAVRPPGVDRTPLRRRP